MANYLAPQFKGMHLEEENKLEAAKDNIKIEIAEMKRNVTEQLEPEEDIENVDKEEPPMSPNTKLRLKMQARTQRLRTENQGDSLSPIEREFHRYESFSLADKHINILHWWRDHEKVLPLLAKVAKKVLTIPASSSKSQRIFSTGGNFVSKKRNRLAPKKVEELLLIKENKSQIETFKARGNYELKKIKTDPFKRISVDEVIGKIVEDEMDDLGDSDIFASDTEEEEILFLINDYNDEEDETDDEEPSDDNDTDSD